MARLRTMTCIVELDFSLFNNWDGFFFIGLQSAPFEGYIHIYHTADNRLQAIDSPISSSSLFTLASM